MKLQETERCNIDAHRFHGYLVTAVLLRLSFLWCGEGLVGDLRFDLIKQGGGGRFLKKRLGVPIGSQIVDVAHI